APMSSECKFKARAGQSTGKEPCRGARPPGQRPRPGLPIEVSWIPERETGYFGSRRDTRCTRESRWFRNVRGASGKAKRLVGGLPFLLALACASPPPTPRTAPSGTSSPIVVPRTVVTPDEA